MLVSHLHHDHLDPPSIKRLGTGVRLVAPRGAGAFLQGHGFTAVTELAPGESHSTGGVEVTATPAAHGGRRWPVRGPVAEAVGFEIAGSRRVYFAGDTDLFDAMADMAGRLDLALLPVAGWGPRLGPGHLNPESAAQAAALLRPRVAVPIHWGTLFRMGLARTRPDLVHRPPQEFAAHVAALAPDVQVRVLEPGGSLELP